MAEKYVHVVQARRIIKEFTYWINTACYYVSVDNFLIYLIDLLSM
mgnify:CR=1 FL=1